MQQLAIAFRGSLLTLLLAVLLLLPASSPAFANDPGDEVWSQGAGTASGNVLGTAVAVTADGGTLVTGYEQGIIDFGDGVSSRDGDHHIFLAKYGPSGALEWVRHYGGGGFPYTSGTDAGVGQDGSIFLTGHYRGEVDFGGGPLPSASGVAPFLAKFDAEGNHVWSRSFGNTSSVDIDLALSPGDEVTVAGSFWGTLDFGTGSLESAGVTDVFLARFDGDGHPLWSERFGDQTNQYVREVTSNSSGDVVLIGDGRGAVDFGGGPLGSEAHLSGVFIAKLDQEGDHLWSKGFAQPDDSQLAEGIATDADGNIIFTGYYSRAIDLGGGALPDGPGSDNFLAKYGPDGSFTWAKSLGHLGYGGGINRFAVAADRAGNTVLAGNLHGRTDLGGGEIAGSYEIVVAQFDRDGSFLWNKVFHAANPSFFGGLAVRPNGEPVVTGYGAKINFGPDPDGGHSGMFVATLAGALQSDADGAAGAARRPAFLRGVPDPTEVSTDPAVAGTNLILAIIAVIVVLLAAHVFNDTIKENNDEIQRLGGRYLRPIGAPFRAAGRLWRTVPGRGARAVRGAGVITILLGTAVVYGFLNQDFKTDESGLMLVSSIVLAIGATTYVQTAAESRVAGRNFGVPVELRVFPAALAIAVAFVLASRITSFEPGVVYGFVASTVILGQLATRQRGLVAVAAAGALLLAFMVAWVLLIPFREWAEHDENFLAVVMESTCVLVVVSAVQGLTLGMVPLGASAGSRIYKLSVIAWGVIAALAVFLFLHVLLTQEASGLRAAEARTTIATVIVLAVCLTLTASVWGLFRLYNRRPALTPPPAVESAGGSTRID